MKFCDYHSLKYFYQIQSHTKGPRTNGIVYSDTSIFKIKLNFVAGLSVKPSIYLALDLCIDGCIKWNMRTPWTNEHHNDILMKRSNFARLSVKPLFFLGLDLCIDGCIKRNMSIPWTKERHHKDLSYILVRCSI